jgi:hypothetical protein
MFLIPDLVDFFRHYDLYAMRKIYKASKPVHSILALSIGYSFSTEQRVQLLCLMLSSTTKIQPIKSHDLFTPESGRMCRYQRYQRRSTSG